MASQLTLGTRLRSWTINTRPEFILGKGAYGIVYRATDSKNQTVAAKTIDGKKHPRVLTQDTQKLLKLSHDNVVNILHFHRQGDKFWMFMELCCHGDLNDFFCKNTLGISRMLEVMLGLARGVKYLHSQNIIHRDIKPANILIACDSPILPKLTDFDLSKSFDPDFETSVMSSNVGTNAFKAPEFFKRVDGKIRYHRNVDVYACALTFLAMIQGVKKSKQLIPQIETAQDSAELYMPIGQLIAERIKYNVPELEIVSLGRNEESVSDHGDVILQVKCLIREMTRINPEERLPASEVLSKVSSLSDANETRTDKEKTREILIKMGSKEIKEMFQIARNIRSQESYSATRPVASTVTTSPTSPVPLALGSTRAGDQTPAQLSALTAESIKKDGRSRVHEFLLLPTQQELRNYQMYQQERLLWQNQQHYQQQQLQQQRESSLGRGRKRKAEPTHTATSSTTGYSYHSLERSPSIKPTF